MYLFNIYIINILIKIIEYFILFFVVKYPFSQYISSLNSFLVYADT